MNIQEYHDDRDRLRHGILTTIKAHFADRVCFDTVGFLKEATVSLDTLLDAAFFHGAEVFPEI